MNKKNPAEDLLAAVLVILAVAAIRDYFQNDRNQLISTRGRQVLGDEKLMRKVNEELEKHENEGISGPVVVDLDN
jgi:hypothetical protein